MPSEPKRPPGRLPLKDQAYEAIRHHIVTCRFPPGARLNEAQVAETLGLSRMPVRDALARLRLEELVTILPRKGIEVNRADPEELLQIIEVRTVNECHAVRLAAGRVTREQISAMKQVLRRTEAALARRDTEALMLLDREFHDIIARAAGNPIIAGLLANLHDRAARFWFISLEREAHQPAVLQEHRAILDALAAQDPAEAARAMGRHIAAFRRNVMRLIGPATPRPAKAGRTIPALRPALAKG
ncbi:GntR family transcriptional regulator [Roseomonas xinghualingensis]|uniref:GntR family transcriptional regulator n=1 Tax=Roseomonas xinghualingensis TaxID=2986475 RepID=UPI0021F22694|nr:GntR family transcriptional regulator [Roseomonas sp. SXEYE001]MCV4206500.1 GntR family transcriptional regulator [Roseomonas sp. SXEYE001]